MNKRRFQIIAGVVADKANVKIRPGRGWQADIENNIIYYPKNEQLTKTDLGYVIHEAAHLRYTDVSHNFFEQYLKELKEEHKKRIRPIFDLFNTVEDIRIEDRIVKKYKGAKEFLDTNNEACHEEYMRLLSGNTYSKKMAEKSKMFQQKWDENLHVQYCISLFQRAQLGKEHYESLKVYHNPEVSEVIEDAVEKVLDKKGNFGDTQECFEFIEEQLLEDYLKLCDDINPDEQDELMDQLKELFEQAKDLIEELSDSGDKIDEKNIEEIENVIKVDSIDDLDIVDELPEKDDNDGVGVVIVSEDDNIEDQEGMDIVANLPNQKKDDENIVKKKQEQKDKQAFSSSEFLKVSDLKNQINKHMSDVRKAIDIVKDREYTRWIGGRKRGKLNSNELYKIKTDRCDVFEQKNKKTNDNKDLCFSMIIDESSSMSGVTAKHACISATLLGSALDYINKSFSVYGFHSDFFIHKNWSDQLDLEKMLDLERNTTDQNSGSTRMGTAIKTYAENFVDAPREKNQVLIVISDGRPNGPVDVGQQVDKISNKVETFAIGIQDHSVENIFEESTVIEDSEELAPVLEEFFKQKFEV